VKVLAKGKRFWRILLDVLFPRTCVICQKPLGTDSSYDHVCDRCSSSIVWTDAQESENLFSRYKREAAERGQKTFFNRGMTCWEHSGTARQLILAMKYKGGNFLIRDIIAMIKQSGHHVLNFVKDSLLVPVPTHYFKRVQRDYSQTELIADSLSHYAGVPVAKRLLACKNHGAQTNLTTEERLLNVKNIFRCNANDIDKFTRIVIVDDVITTGATLFACCAAMHRRGFRDVNILTLSHS
jgi:ComF family protein